ncbi:acyl carrier protein [Humitalea sp. 24SJ18S-53]|uniref:acyl carrier protein n=1 Tax=Humitalea sp. 24SJ18S-53 TaxID=3422307 RepID=UPI003D674E0F
MSRPIGDVTNWMTMFRWIVKLIRDEYGVEEAKLTRHALLETEIGLSIEQIEEVLGTIGDAFTLRFPDGTLDEILRLEELCMLASWVKGFYKRPEFISTGFEATCRGANPGIA